MREDAYRCDVCDVKKGETNHWYLVTVDEKGFNVCGWESAKAEAKTVKHCCGQSCVHKTLDKFFAPSAPILVQNLDEDDAINLSRVAFPS